MKPNGLRLELRNGALEFRVSRPSHVEDAIWKAVEGAVDANWTVESFRAECAEAWRHKQKQDAKADAAQWSKR